MWVSVNVLDVCKDPMLRKEREVFSEEIGALGGGDFYVVKFLHKKMKSSPM